MGQQHNTHIVNKTGELIKIVLTDRDNRNTTQVIENGSYVNVPTPHGRNSVSVFVKYQGEWDPTAAATYTDDSDRSFIVKKVSGQIQVVRSVYGNIHKEETGLRPT